MNTCPICAESPVYVKPRDIGPVRLDAACNKCTAVARAKLTVDPLAAEAIDGDTTRGAAVAAALAAL